MVAQKAGALADVQGELTSMAANLKDSVELKALFEDPSIKIAQQKSALAAVLGAGGFTPTTQNFFTVVVENRRLASFPKIVADFERLMKAESGEMVATVQTAAKMTAAQTKKITAALKSNASISGGKAITITQEVNPEILGGMIVEIEDKVIDASTRTRLMAFTHSSLKKGEGVRPTSETSHTTACDLTSSRQ